MKLLGITGRKGSGKSTYAKAVTNTVRNTRDNWRVYNLAFATPLKKLVEAKYGIDPAILYGPSERREERLPFWADRLGENFSTARKILQWEGTEVARDQQSSQFWVHRAELELEASYDVVPREAWSRTLIIFDDVRFNEEALFLRKNGARIVNVERVGMPEPTDTHRSEEGIDTALVDSFLHLTEAPKEIDLHTLQWMIGYSE